MSYITTRCDRFGMRLGGRTATSETKEKAENKIHVEVLLTKQTKEISKSMNCVWSLFLAFRCNEDY